LCNSVKINENKLKDPKGPYSQHFIFFVTYVLPG
jgi:hypothetical protein